MKALLLGLMAAFTLNTTNSFACGDIPSEVSALLQEARYQDLLNLRKQLAQESGLQLHILGFDVLDLPPQKFVFINLATSPSADPFQEPIPSGAIVGSAVSGPLGEVLFDGVYYKPSGDIPGGASVGNN